MYLPKIRALASISIVSIKSKECHLRQSARFYHISSINVIKTLEVHLRLQIQRCRLRPPMTLKIIGPICAYNHTKLQLSISNSYHATADNIRFIVKMWPQGNRILGLDFLWIQIWKKRNMHFIVLIYVYIWTKLLNAAAYLY